MPLTNSTKFISAVRKRLEAATPSDERLFELADLVSVGPKLEICRTYYSELSGWSCLFSHVGLPPRSSK